MTVFNLVKRGLKFLILVATLAGLGLAATHRQTIIDWARLYNYQPSSSVVELADNTTMTDYSRHIFYVNKPALLGKQDFNNHCHANEQSIILGCYIETKGIYLFNVQEPQLNGIHEVTAAHEMLHGAYDRLGSAERQKLNQELDSFFLTLNNERIKKTVELYRQKDPKVVTNELHSILGTEVQNLTPELEAHYKKYFSNRAKVVNYSEHYEQAFTQLRDKEAKFRLQLDKLKDEINNNEATLTTLEQEINSERAELDKRLSSGDVAGYNSLVPTFNAKIRRYNVLVNETKNLISQHNGLVEELNKLVTQEQSLNQAIDSRLNTKGEK